MDRVKGHTKFELTDVKTGEMQKIESGNMVTEALNKIVEPIGIFNDADIFHNLSPFCHTLTGGLLLFNEKIPDDRNTIFAPSSAHMTGCAVYNMSNDTKNSRRGDFNKVESEEDFIKGRVKYVYDFKTNQGNGTIACACLTSDKGGYCGYGNDPMDDMYNIPSAQGPMAIQLTARDLPFFPFGYQDKSFTQFGNLEAPILIDPEEDAAYSLQIDYYGDNEKIRLVKRRAHLKSTSLFFTNPIGANYYAGAEWEKELDVAAIVGNDLPAFKNDNSTSPRLSRSSLNVDAEAMTAYYTYGEKQKVTVPKGGNACILGIKIPSGEMTFRKILNDTEYDFELCHVEGGILYARLGDGKGFAKIKMEDPSSKTIITRPNDKEDIIDSNVWKNHWINTYVFGIYNGNVVLQVPGHGSMIIGNDNNVRLTETRRIDPYNDQWIRPVKVKGLPEIFYSAGGGAYCMMGNYLATINNLDKPITKTNQQTMKVTYTLERA